jgi:hypothetical protein
MASTMSVLLLSMKLVIVTMTALLSSMRTDGVDDERAPVVDEDRWRHDEKRIVEPPIFIVTRAIVRRIAGCAPERGDRGPKRPGPLYGGTGTVT